MSMLAERRVKQKWSLNPRGKEWSDDSNKFGQKMLEKMGWSRGKGLGPNENGITEHVKVSYKNDSRGMGFKETNDQWTEHESHFNSLLQSLSGSNENSLDGSLNLASLEKKSQSSRVRVHYKKFTRGKDLSRCSEKDLANIFGKKSLKKQSEDVIKEEVSEDKNESFMYNRGSMLDYFKKKLPNFGKSNGYVVGSNGVLKKDSESEDEGYVGFGFKRKSDEDGESCTPKKMKIDGFSNPAFDPLAKSVEVQKHALNTITEEEEDAIANTLEDYLVNSFLENSESKKKKKKKKITVEDEIIDQVPKKKKKQKKEAVVNPNFDNSCNGDESQDNNTFEVKRKKKQKKHEDLEEKKEENGALAVVNPNFSASFNGEESQDNNTFEIKRKKNKKNEELVITDLEEKKEENSALAVVNPNFSISFNGEEIRDNNTFEVKRKKKKKNEEMVIAVEDEKIVLKEKISKKKKNEESSVLAVVNPNFSNSFNGDESQDNNAFEVKRKKKRNTDSEESKNNVDKISKKKRKEDSSGLAVVNPNFSNSFNGDESQDNNTFEVKRKQKKKNEELAIENPNFVANDTEESQTNAAFEVKRKKKQKNAAEDERENKKKKSEIEDLTISESNLEFDLMLNITATPQANSTLLSSAKKSSSSKLKRRKSVRFSDVNEERIIPNNDDQNRNELFDINSRVLSLEAKIDGCQAEVENDLNEERDLNFVGEVGDPDGENEKLPNGTRLKFKHAKFGRSPNWINKQMSKAKTSYKHLIKGDIVLGFTNTNLHEIKGYAQDDNVS